MPFNTIRPSPPPAEFPLTPLAIGGTLVWIALALVFMYFSTELHAHGRGWWIHCAWTGAALGCVGTITMMLHDRKRRRDSRL